MWTIASWSNTIALVEIIVYIFSNFMQLSPQQRCLHIDTLLTFTRQNAIANYMINVIEYY